MFNKQVFGKRVEVPAARIFSAIKTPVASARDIDSAYRRIETASNEAEHKAAMAAYAALVN